MYAGKEIPPLSKIENYNAQWKLVETRGGGKAEWKNGWKNCSAAIEYIAQGYVICTYCLFILDLFGGFFFSSIEDWGKKHQSEHNEEKKYKIHSGTATIHRTEAKPRKRGNEETRKNNENYEHAWNERAI